MNPTTKTLDMPRIPSGQLNRIANAASLGVAIDHLAAQIEDTARDTVAGHEQLGLDAVAARLVQIRSMSALWVELDRAVMGAAPATRREPVTHLTVMAILQARHNLTGADCPVPTLRPVLVDARGRVLSCDLVVRSQGQYAAAIRKALRERSDLLTEKAVAAISAAVAPTNPGDAANAAAVAAATPMEA